MYKLNLHDETDPVNYKSDKDTWIDFEPDVFEFGDVPYMSTGRHVTRYEDQKFLEDIYLNHKDKLIEKLIEYFDKFH